MAVAIYYVLRGEDHWIIRFNERDYGHNTLTSALKSAIAAARTSTEDGHDVQILVQWPDNSWVVTWTSEDDFSPATEAPEGDLGSEPRAPARPAPSSVSERSDSRREPLSHEPRQA